MRNVRQKHKTGRKVLAQKRTKAIAFKVSEQVRARDMAENEININSRG